MRECAILRGKRRERCISCMRDAVFIQLYRDCRQNSPDPQPNFKQRLQTSPDLQHNFRQQLQTSPDLQHNFKQRLQHYTNDFMTYKTQAEAQQIDFSSDNKEPYNRPFISEELNYCLSNTNDTPPWDT